MLLLELFSADGRQPVLFSFAVVLGYCPFGGDPALQFDALERRIERTKFDVQRIAAARPNRFGDGIAVQRTEPERLQDQHVQGSFEQVHMKISYMKVSSM